MRQLCCSTCPGCQCVVLALVWLSIATSTCSALLQLEKQRPGLKPDLRLNLTQLDIVRVSGATCMVSVELSASAEETVFLKIWDARSNSDRYTAMVTVGTRPSTHLALAQLSGDTRMRIWSTSSPERLLFDRRLQRPPSLDLGLALVALGGTMTLAVLLWWTGTLLAGRFRNPAIGRAAELSKEVLGLAEELTKRVAAGENRLKAHMEQYGVGLSDELGRLEQRILGLHKIVTESVGRLSQWDPRSASERLGGEDQSLWRAELALRLTVNDWWRRSTRTRPGLLRALGARKRYAGYYVLNQKRSNDRSGEESRVEYVFEAEPRTGGWLLFQEPGRDQVLAVPADPANISGPESDILADLFRGCEALPSPLHFQKVKQLCILGRDSKDGPEAPHTLVEQGELLLDAGPETAADVLIEKIELVLEASLFNARASQQDQAMQEIRKTVYRLQDAVVAMHQKLAPAKAAGKREAGSRKSSTVSPVAPRPEPPPAWDGLPDDWWTSLLAQAQISGSLSPESYWERAEWLALGVAEFLANQTSQLRSKILRITDEPEKAGPDGERTFRFGTVEVKGNQPQDPFSGDLIRGRDLYQLFVAVEKADRTAAALLLPLGDFSKDQHTYVLPEIIEDPPEGPVIVRKVRRPAEFHGRGDGLYLLGRRMILAYDRR